LGDSDSEDDVLADDVAVADDDDDDDDDEDEDEDKGDVDARLVVALLLTTVGVDD
jgi:hypothetical protein